MFKLSIRFYTCTYNHHVKQIHLYFYLKYKLSLFNLNHFITVRILFVYKDSFKREVSYFCLYGMPYPFLMFIQPKTI